MSQNAGYSGKPLTEKLGYSAGDSVYVQDAPIWFIELLNTLSIECTPKLPATWAHVFFTESAKLQKFCNLADFSGIEKGLWVSWPKKSSGIVTNLTEQSFRDAILPRAWVDTKVAAIDETWSGLKFLRRKSS